MRLRGVVKYLGLHLDENLSWREHISQLSSQLSSVCYSLRVLNRYLDLSSVRSVYHAVFEARLRYGIMFYGTSSGLYHIFVQQKRALRTMLKMRMSDSCRGRFRENGLLTVPAIHIQECLMFLFKNKHYFEEKTQSGYVTRSTQLKYPKHRLTLTEKGPEYAAVTYFNSLPRNIRDETNSKTFKGKVFKLLLEMEPYNVDDFRFPIL